MAIALGSQFLLASFLALMKHVFYYHYSVQPLPETYRKNVIKKGFKPFEVQHMYILGN